MQQGFDLSTTDRGSVISEDAPRRFRAPVPGAPAGANPQVVQAVQPGQRRPMVGQFGHRAIDPLHDALQVGAENVRPDVGMKQHRYNRQSSDAHGFLNTKVNKINAVDVMNGMNTIPLHQRKPLSSTPCPHKAPTPMTAAPPASPLASFEIKSANLPLVALLLRSADLRRLTRELAQRFDDIPNFFEQDPLVIDLSPLANSADADTPIDFLALTQLLRQYQLQPLAVKGGSAAHMADALATGLVAAGDAQVLQARVPSPPTAAPAQPEVTAPLGAMVVDKPLRSGQQVYARGRDLVVLAMVNPGAEVIADGSIHVYAPLRGKAIAGARGNPDARIFSLALDAELLSIAGVYRTSDTPLPADVQGKPAQVRLMANEDGDKLVISPMTS